MLSTNPTTPTGAAVVLAFLLLVFASYEARRRSIALLLGLAGTAVTVVSYARTGLSSPLAADFGLQLALLSTTASLILAYRRSREHLQERSARLATLMDTSRM